MKDPEIGESKAAEIAMSRLAAIVESSDDAIIGKDLKGIITSWNQGAEKIFGYAASEMVGTSILRLIPPERHAEEDFILEKIRRGEKVEHFETVRQTKDGRLIDISVTASPIKDGAGNIIGASKIARDITVHKTHEQEVLRLSRLYAALSQINQAIVWTRHREELFEKICRVLVELGKFSMAWIGQAEAETRRVKPVARWGDKSDYLSQMKIYIDERLEGQGPVGTAIREGNSYVCNDFAQDLGTVPWRELANRAGFRAMAAFPIRQGGAVCGAVMVYSGEIGFFRDKEIALLEEAASDVSFALDYLLQDEKRQQAELAMRVSEERYRALFDRSLDCVFLNDFAGNFLDANQAALDLLGYQRADLATLTFASLLTEDQLPLAFQVTEEIKVTGHQQRPAEFRLRGKDGRQVYVETRSSLIYHEGKPFAVQGIARDLTERRRAEELVQTSEQRLNAFFTSAPAGLVLLDKQLRYLQLNETVAKINGVPVKDHLGKTVREVLPHLAPVAEPLLQKVLATGEPMLNVELSGETPSQPGVPRHWLESFFPILGKDGRPDGVGVIFVEITESKRAEAALRENEAALAEAQQIAKLGSWQYDLASNSVRWSDELCRIFEIEGPQFNGTHEVFLNCVLPEDRPKVRQVNAEATAEGKPFEIEYRIQTRTGELKHIREIGYAHKDAGGKVVSLFGTAQDITGPKRAEESLRLLNSAVLQAKESVVITDAQLELPGPKIVFVNPAFTQMTGYRAEEVIGKTPRILQGPRTDKNVLTRLRKNLERGEVFDGEAIQYRKDGTEYVQEWQIAPLRDDTGKITHYVAIQRDISAHRELEAQFRQVQKMESFGQLAGGVAHDFNNILAVIQMQIDLMRDDGRLTPEQLDGVGEIGTATQRATDLTRQLLLFSRKEKMQPRDLDLNECINNVIKMLRRILGENFEMQLKMTMQPVFLCADAGMLDQVVMNLVVNARDAMPKGGRLSIETATVDFDETVSAQSAQARPGSFVCLSVSDNGCGIPAENLSRIFEPFFTTKSVGKGTGLGLATVFGIVQQHQGWIDVASEVGLGTTFRIYFPRLRQPPAASQKKPSSQLSTLRGGTETILLVEDDDSVRSAICNILSRLGYRLLSVNNAVKALEVWRERRDEIQLVLTDLVMPGGMSGKDLGERLLQEDPKVKVIYASGYSAEVVGKTAFLEAGVNFVSKPFDAQQLAQAIRNCLDSSARRNLK